MAVQQTGNLRFLPKSRELVQEMPDLDFPGTIKEKELKIQKAREMLGLSTGSKLPDLLIDMPPGRVVIFSGERARAPRT
jgi:hypothetical protein